MSDPERPPAAAPAGGDPTAVMGRRIGAWAIDLGLFVALVGGLYAVGAEPVEVPTSLAGDFCGVLRRLGGDQAAGCVEIGDRAYVIDRGEAIVQSVAAIAYFAFFVWMQGRTGASPGKLVTGVRVVRADGSRPGPARSLGRTLLWAVDGAPWVLPLVGAITGLTTTGHRRVGDMAADTYVVGRTHVGVPVPGVAPDS